MYRFALRCGVKAGFKGRTNLTCTFLSSLKARCGVCQRPNHYSPPPNTHSQSREEAGLSSNMERLEEVGKGCHRITLIPDVSYLLVRATFEMANVELTPRYNRANCRAAVPLPSLHSLLIPSHTRHRVSADSIRACPWQLLRCCMGMSDSCQRSTSFTSRTILQP